MKMIPISKPELHGKESVYLNHCIKTGWVSSLGHYISEFEQRFSEFIGQSYSLSCSNGTTALHLALLSLDIGEGDEVIVPSFTFIATVNSILYCRAKPIFADIDPVTWCLDPQDVAKKLSTRTKAILIVHLYGNPADMSALTRISEENGVYLIEDCAEALGASYKERYVGSFGHVSCHSFYGNKIITCGEGGMISTASEEISNRIKMLRDHGMSSRKRYLHEMLAYNYRMTNLQAALGLAQLQRIDDFLSRRQQIFNEYVKQLNDVSEIGLPFLGDIVRKPVNWMFTIVLKNGNRDALMEHLRKHGIDTRPVFYPCHKMPYIDANCILPITNSVSGAGISLPTFVGLKKQQIIYICDCIKKYFALLFD